MWCCSCCKYWSCEGSRPQKQLFYGVYSYLAHNERGWRQFDVHFRSQHGLENNFLINSHCWQLWNILNIWFIPLCYTPVSQHCYPITHGVHLTFSLQIYRGKESYIWRNESCGVYIYYTSYGIFHLMFEGLACDKLSTWSPRWLTVFSPEFQDCCLPLSITAAAQLGVILSHNSVFIRLQQRLCQRISDLVDSLYAKDMCAWCLGVKERLWK